MFCYLLPGSQFLPPLLQLQAVLLVQLLQLLGLVFDQQVALLVLKQKQSYVILLQSFIKRDFGVVTGADLQLLQLADVGVTLELQVSHLVFVLLLLVQPLVLLPLLFLSCELETRLLTKGWNSLRERFTLRAEGGGSPV